MDGYARKQSNDNTTRRLRVRQGLAVLPKIKALTLLSDRLSTCLLICVGQRDFGLNSFVERQGSVHLSSRDKRVQSFLRRSEPRRSRELCRHLVLVLLPCVVLQYSFLFHFQTTEINDTSEEMDETMLSASCALKINEMVSQRKDHVTVKEGYYY
jgi:hypothetical protein